ncbi:MAG: hypothetical protein NC311_09180 [Muribaculaceae bacterium]|nr:hypothetical protein [Muribaculaceae bacterium]
MIYYKNVFLNISNSLNSRRVSNAPNPYADMDIQMLARACQEMRPVIATNGNAYYYFVDNYMSLEMIQYLLNVNGVVAYRRYSGYQVFYGGRQAVVRVPIKYLDKHPNARAFMDKVVDARSNAMGTAECAMSKYIDIVQQRMRGK